MDYYQRNKERIKKANLERYHKKKGRKNPVGRPRKPFPPYPENNIPITINGLLEMFDTNEAARPVRDGMPIVQSVFLPMQEM